MFKKSPLLSRVSVFIVLPLCLLLSGVIYIGKSSLELRQGSVSSTDIEHKVSISYTPYDVPKIKASTDKDAFFAIGFAHAQNRLWQMEMDRRIAAGRLSEVLGKSAVSSDVFIRTIGLRDNAERMLAQLSDSDIAILEAYTGGVNAGIEALKVLPPEYLYYGFKAEPWTKVHSLLKLQLLMLQSSSNLSDELLNSTIVGTFGVQEVNELLDIGLVEGKADFRGFGAGSYDELLEKIPKDYKSPKAFIGSSALAVSGKFTLSGKPMVVSDIHEDNLIPSAFYLVNVRGDKLKVSGASYPGLPFVVSGRNEHVAWSGISMYADTQDVYVERVNPLNFNQYEVDGKYLDMSVREEKIAIRAGRNYGDNEKYLFDVRRTHRGPVISDITGLSNNVLSLRWSGDDADGSSFGSFVNINYAKHSTELIDGLSEHVAPIISFVYADNENNLGSVVAGKYPVRKEGVGLLPIPGWNSDNDWKSWTPFRKRLRNLNPASGIVIETNYNALNNAVISHIDKEKASDYRSMRIYDLILEQAGLQKNRLTVKDIVNIQLGKKHPFASLIGQYLNNNPFDNLSLEQKKGIEFVKKWDGAPNADSIATAIVSTWLVHLNNLIFEDDIKKSGKNKRFYLDLLIQDHFPIIERVLSNEDSSLCKYEFKDVTKSCNEVVRWAFDRAIHEMNSLLGDNFDNWAWGEVAEAHYYHFPLSGSMYNSLDKDGDNKMLSIFFRKTIPARGFSDSFDFEVANLNNRARFLQLSGISYRQALDLGASHDDYYSLSIGQSGNIFSENFGIVINKFNGDSESDDTLSDKMYGLEIVPTNIGELYEH